MHLLNSNASILIYLIFAGLAGLIIAGQFRKTRMVKRLFSEQQRNVLLSNYSGRIRVTRLSCLIISLFLICFSLLDPRWGSKNTEYSMEGIDIVMVMDVSRSMETPDVTPNRLEYSQGLAQQLISLLIGNRIGIAGFAGFGFKVIPMTMDVDAAIIFLNELSTSMIDMQGTNLEDALKKALELFDDEALTHKAIVVFTDGEDMENAPMNQVEAAEEMGVTVFTVGIGTEEGGVVPLLDDDGNELGYLEDSTGTAVVSQLDEALLTEVAEATGGFYVNGNEDTVIQLAQKLNEIKKSKFGANMTQYMQPQYQYFLAMGLILLFIYLFLPDRKSTKRVKRENGFFSKAWVSIALLLLIPTAGFSSDASDGVSAYHSGDYETALDYFQKAIINDSDNERLLFNEANTYYQLGEYDKAASVYGSLTESEDEELQLKSLYNLGNTFYMAQDAEEALNYYKTVLDNADPESDIYEKALENFILAKQQFAQQQQQQQEDEDESDDSQDSDDEGSDDTQQNETEQDDSGDEQQQQQSQQEEIDPISPSDIESLLNLIEEEEKEHLTDEEEPEGFMFSPRNEW